ncbi:MAG: carboxypeptidase M32 [Desulfomonile tiedjei]|uniref:Metal-dependent carboxypeptidase n=1 Tax=Desulfomonile tiedjei TaxID=2358 RepID=A0A9D6V504_9BACT|nr:carboxypeptidase M32 [Desulfomonile tiedjei]
MNPKDSYEKISAHSKEMTHLGSAMAILNWDQRTQIPRSGHASRAQVLATMAGMIHKMATDPRVGEWLSILENSHVCRDPLAIEAVNVREWRRSFDRATKIPQELAVEIARAAAEGQSVWEKARPENDWKLFEPYLERIVGLKREEAQALGFENEPYDALLDAYERAETARNLEPVFKRLTEALVALLQRIISSGRQPDPCLKHLYFPIAEQEAFAVSVAKRIGYDMEAGRLDVSAHPFTTGIAPGDVRITTRYSENYFNEAFFGVIHETGHALYHQGLPLDHWGTPFCRPISLGINESQSRMWENLVARSKEFWRCFYPEAQARFKELGAVDEQDFYFSINNVRPSLIRVEADEVTYNIHILLRFELEVLLIRGDLDVRDLPDAWNSKMQAYLGVTPPDFSQGSMQDVHWSSGSIGYFPTYTLGNLYSAQFFAQAEKDLGDLRLQIERGEFAPLLDWLRRKIHNQGTRYLPRDLVKTVTGEDLDSQFLIDYLERKYSELYAL